MSPLLANIYLHYVLDLWFKVIFRAKARGYVQLIRYCDDFVVACEREEDARRFLAEVEERFSGFGLSLSEEKTRIVEEVREYFRARENIIDTDGVRVNFGDGWGLLRSSNTQAILVLRFEARTPERLEEIKEMFRERLKGYLEAKF